MTIELTPPVAPAQCDHLLSEYHCVGDRFDELLAGPRLPRPHWSRIYEKLASVSRAEIDERQAAAERQIRDSGVTYNVYADPNGIERPWELDVLPFVISPEDWRVIEAGISQRAKLLNLILGDLYGDQELIRTGEIPATLIHGQSGFLRPAHQTRPAGGVHLHLYAADLARSPDGRWWVMADRTQAPSGAGYALENRLIVSRIFPTLFRDLRVQHLARFFATLRDSLMYHAPTGDGPTLTVLLTPGPYNETYFEHTLLARYLGFPLVEGGDLTVRGGRVWLKTLGGLRRVHAILRRQDDVWCDPLELRTDSALGVAGLTDCARRGTVLLANSLGSGLLESGALLGFLPRLCKQLLGEPLKLPSIATWWCGESAALHDALNNVDHVVFKSADPADWFDPIFGQDLDGIKLKELKRRLHAHPERFVAHEMVRFSQAPILGRTPQQPITARGIGLRVFAVASPTGYVLMPGGLTRVASNNDVRIMAMQRGGGSKDTWVLSDGPVDTGFTLLRSTVSVTELQRSSQSTPSRIAENLYWFGRFQERCDDEARLLREAMDQGLREDDDETLAIRPVLALASAYGIIDSKMPIEAELIAAAIDESKPCSLPANLRTLERLAHTLRDRVSLDNLRTINSLLRSPLLGRRTPTLAAVVGWLNQTVTNLTTLSGFAIDGMTRDSGWRFLSIGRRLERLIFQCLSLRIALDSGPDSGLTWLLRLSDSIVTYHSRYMSRPEWLPVLDLLMQDITNPRSIAFQSNGICGYLKLIESTYGNYGSERFAAAAEALSGTKPSDLNPESDNLRARLISLHDEALKLNDHLSQCYFSHVRSSSFLEQVY